MKITEALHGRIIEHVEYTDDGGVDIVCQDGRVVHLGIAKNEKTSRWQILMTKVSTKLVLPGLIKQPTGMGIGKR